MKPFLTVDHYDHGHRIMIIMGRLAWKQPRAGAPFLTPRGTDVARTLAPVLGYFGMPLHQIDEAMEMVIRMKKFTMMVV